MTDVAVSGRIGYLYSPGRIMLLDTTHVVSDLQLEYDSCLVAKDDSLGRLAGADRQWVALSLACGTLYEL